MQGIAGAAKALVIAAGVWGLFGTQAEAAGRSAYCADYAHEEANRKANAGNVLSGTIGGALGGALIGGLIDGGKGAGRGAIIGGVGGTVLGAGATNSKWHRVYRKKYEDCMDSYAAEPVDYESPEPGTRAWYRYCAARYRSFDPETGTFLSDSGEYKPCR